jgi:hypothetical protein
MDALNDTWGPATGLTFDRLSSCQAAGAGTALKMLLHLYTNPLDTGNGSCPYGIGVTCTFNIPVNPSIVGVYYLFVHEVGHALHMAHEHQRGVPGPGPDGLVHEVPLCPHEQNLLNAGFNTWDRTAAPFPAITTQYDRCSIQNYCRGQHDPEWSCTSANNLDVSSLKAGHSITPLDALGAEVLYPKGNVPLGCHESCFLTGDGVVLRGGYVRDSWTARGANAWTNFLIWNNGPAQAAYSPGPGLHYVEFEGTSKYTNRPIVGGGMVNVDHSQWTAIALSIL